MEIVCHLFATFPTMIKTCTNEAWPLSLLHFIVYYRMTFFSTIAANVPTAIWRIKVSGSLLENDIIGQKYELMITNNIFQLEIRYWHFNSQEAFATPSCNFSQLFLCPITMHFLELYLWQLASLPLPYQPKFRKLWNRSF